MAQHNILYIRTWQKGSSKQLDLGRDQTEIKIIGNQVVQPLPIRKILSSHSPTERLLAASVHTNIQACTMQKPIITSSSNTLVKKDSIVSC